MADLISIRLMDQDFCLLPQKAVLWNDRKYLLVSDIHAGKAGHFRKHGIPISSTVLLHDLLKLEKLIETHKPEKVLILGDLFHSSHNDENTFVLDWLKNLAVDYLLIEGNHDAYSLPGYRIKHVPELIDSEIRLCHEWDESNAYFTISGHIHPAYLLRGKGRQSMRFPCFWKRKNSLVLPAFGSLTGTYCIKSSAEDKVYLISENAIFPA